MRRALIGLLAVGVSATALASEPSGKCAELVEKTGPAPCPYPKPARNAKRWGTAFSDGGRCVSAGLLTLSSGRITATDPLVFLHMPPFKQAVPTGRARVWLAMNRRNEVAYALAQLGDATPVRWRRAVDGKGGSAYPVDAGVGCFADATVPAALRVRKSDGFDLLAAMESAGLYRQRWANVCIDPATGANLIGFPSGEGDGSYASYFGFDAEGRVVALVTDFKVDDSRFDR